jgi:hypothetical protein
MTTGDDNGRLPGEDEADGAKEAAKHEEVLARFEAHEIAERVANAERVLAAVAEVDALPYRLPRKKALGIAVLAEEVGEEAKLWLSLATRTGPDAVFTLLGGGAAGIEGRQNAEKAIETRRKRARDTAAWMQAESRGVPKTKGRQPLLVVEHEGEPVPYLPGGVVGLVVAAGGTGKTTWLAELAMRVAWSRGGAAKAPPYRVADGASGPVLVVLAEEDADGLDSTLARGLRLALGEKKAAEVSDEEWAERVFALGGADRVTALGSLVTLEDPVRGRVQEVIPSALHDVLCEKARTMGPMLVVLDPLNQLLPAGASENDATTAAALIALVGEIRAAAEEGVRTRWAEKEGRPPEDYCGPRPSALVAHHVRKGSDGGADAARGSSAFVDNARWVLGMRREDPREGHPDRASWSIEKTNYTRALRHRAVVDTSVDWLAWRPETAEEKAAWDDPKSDPKKTREALLEALGAAGDRGMTRSQADSAHGREVVNLAEEEGLVVAEKKGNGARLRLADRIALIHRLDPFDAGDDDTFGGCV